MTAINQKPLHCFVPGEKVFVPREQRLATVLNVYGNGLTGAEGEIRLDLCGNTAIDDIEPYDVQRHGAFDATFVPIKAEWKDRYGISLDVPLRD